MSWRLRAFSAGLSSSNGRAPHGFVIALAAVAGPLASPAGGAPPPRPLVAFPASGRNPSFVGVIGDSTGSQLAVPLAAEMNARHVGVVSATVGGCQPTDLVLTYQSPEYFENHRNCPRDAKEYQDDLTFRFRPKVVIWSDIMEWSDVKLAGRVVAAGSDEWKRLMLDGWDHTLGRLGSAHVALILPTWWAGQPANTPPSFPVDRQRALFRTWAGRHPDRVTVVDLGPVVCPSGPPCEQVVSGVRLRTDHVHYTPEGARRAIARILTDVPALKNIR